MAMAICMPQQNYHSCWVSINGRLQIIQGAISIGIGIVAIFTLPDSPLQTRWLTPEERELAHRRIFDDVTNRRSEASSVWKGLRECLVDEKVWVSVETCPHAHATTDC